MIKPKPQTLVELLQLRAVSSGSKPAYVFIEDGDRVETPISYAELDARVRAIAAELIAMGAKGERALLLYPPGLEFIAAFFGCLYAGVTAVPTYPPRLNRPMPRIQAIVRDADAKFALTTGKILGSVKKRSEHESLLATLRWCDTEPIPAAGAADWQPEELRPDRLAFLQYTSGSTSAPKGVMVTHANLMHNLEMIRRGFRLQDNEKGVFWLPSYHDMGLIGGILEPLYAAASSILLSPVAFLQRPSRWLDAITRFEATITGAPNFAFDLCVDQITPEQRAGLDLSSLRLCFTGAEPVRPATLARFTEAFGPHGFRESVFYPCYGLAEATLLVAGGDGPGKLVRQAFDREAIKQNRVRLADGGDDHDFIGCGRALLDEEIAIVDPEERTVCAPGEIGEIWVRGGHIAQGYWGRPDLSAVIFDARTSDTGEGPYLRTGDLGFLHDGELFVTGRLKDLIIIRGKNHYPQDIENTAADSHSAIEKTAVVAFSYEEDGEEKLALAAEVTRKHRKPDLGQVIPALRRAIVEEHGLQPAALVLVRPLSIPKTSSGKVKRQATRQAFLDGTLLVVGAWNAADAPIPVASSPKPPAPPETPDAARVLSRLLEQLAGLLNLPAAGIDPDEAFAAFGVDSAQAVSLTGDLETFLGRTLSPTLAWDYPTPRRMANYLAGSAGTRLDPVREGGRLSTQAADRAVAIVGLAVRVPGAASPDAFWDLLAHGVDAIQEVPPDRFDVDALYDPEPSTPGKLNTRWGGFLQGIDRFDPLFFGISPREAARMDPQQRLLMEIAWEALESAGIPAGRLAGSSTGVFVGISSYDYSGGQFRDPDALTAYSATGNAHSIAANRLSYFLDLRGPSVAIDTACSSSLVAAHLACRSLRSEETDLAIAAGVNLILSPELTITFSQARMLAPDGRCKTFDARADGYVRSEGAGAVVLKRLRDAVRDGDPIIAVIRGSAVNQDGRSNGLTAPNGPSQEAVIRRALEDAGAGPAQIEYVETHGTGTPLGDPIEMHALRNVLASDRSAEQPLFVGSVKTNIGHLEAAAGIAGLIKTALSLQRGAIPPHLHFETLNPFISLDGAPVRIPTALQSWPRGPQPRLAGVSSFGFGGTNAHLVLSEAPARAEPEKKNPFARPPLSLLTLSARSPAALQDLAERYIHAPPTPWPDAAYTSQTGRAHFEYRLGVLAADWPAAKERLREFLDSPPAQESGRPKVAFLFTGQGAQYPGMTRALYDGDPTYRRILDECARLAGPHLDLPLLDLIFSDDERLHQTRYAQPALFSVEYALAGMWRSWGVEPDFLLGHSLGEWAAACFAGVFRLEDALSLVAHRGRLMQEAPGEGRMLAVAATGPDVAEAIEPYRGRIVIAAVNGPKNLTVSGERAAIEQLAAEFEARGWPQRFLSAPHAFHSPLMEPVLDDFQQLLSEVPLSPPEIPIAANSDGQLRGAGRPFDRAYWAGHIRNEVQFAAGMETLLEQGVGVFLETGPRPTLLSLARRALKDKPGSRDFLPSAGDFEEDWRVAMTSLSRLYELGCRIDWEAFNRPFPTAIVPLPTYPFQRERHWFDSGTAAKSRSARPESFPARPESFPARTLTRLPVAIPVFETRVEDLTQSGLLELALDAGREAFQSADFVVETIRYVVPSPGAAPASLQVVLTDATEAGGHFSIHARRGDEWLLLAHGSLAAAEVVFRDSAAPDLQKSRQTHVDSAAPNPPKSRQTHVDSAAPNPPKSRQTHVDSAAPNPPLPFLHEQIANSLGIPPAELRADRPLNLLGLDSLMAIEIRNAVEKAFRIEIPIVRLLEGATVESLAALVQARIDNRQFAGEIPIVPIAGAHPLTYGQQALWFLHELTGDGTSFNIAGAVRVGGDFQTAALRRALQALIERHPALTTTFHVEDGLPVQQLQPGAAVPLVEVDARGWSHEQLRRYLRREAWRKFNLESGPPFRVRALQTLDGNGAEAWIVLLSVDHLVADFWSVSLIVRELLDAFRPGDQGASPAGRGTPVLKFVDAARWLNAEIDGPAGESHLAYWQKKFGGGLPALNLPTDRPRPRRQTFQGESAHRRLPAALARKLNALAQARGTTLFNVLLAGFQALLHRYSGQEEFVVGSVMTGRERLEFEDLVGYLINPVPLKADLSGKGTYLELLDVVQETVLEAFEHQAYPPSRLAEKLGLARDLSRPPLFETMFIFQKAQVMGEAGLSAFAIGLPGAQIKTGGLRLEIYPLEGQPAQFDLTLMMAEAEDTLLASLQYNTALFDEETIDRMLAHLEALLAGIAADPAGRISGYPLLGAAEKEQIAAWNGAAKRDFPADLTLPAMFAGQAARNPDKTAVGFGERALSYAALDDQSNRLAAHLRTIGLGPNRLAGVYLDRSLHLPVALLGILKAGGAFVPLDPSFPKDRIDFMIADSGLQTILTTSEFTGRFLEGVRVIDIDSPNLQPSTSSFQPPTCNLQPADPAYVIYTSGSTGRPKGVRISHRAVTNFICAMQERPGIRPEDVLLAVTTLSFDISILELFLPLLTGAQLVIAGADVVRDGAALGETLARSGATIMQATPSTWRLMLESGWSGKPDLKILCGGEALPRALAVELLPRCAELWNMYGPTETTIWSTAMHVQDAAGPIAIGRPIANTQVHILDDALNPAPIGVYGELCIAGRGLASGYLDRPELTAEKFVRAGDVRVYRTGDLARWRSDGVLEFAGRRDSQVKVRGYRIELGEIETLMSRFEGVQEAVVTVQKPGTGEARLIGFLVPDSDGVDAFQDGFHRDLRRYLGQHLPEYMLPAAFIPLDALPLTPNGKIDRQSLPEPDGARPALEAPYIPPRNETEKRLAELCAAVLGLDRVGVRDNFFDLGGNSLQATQLVFQVREAFGVRVLLRRLFEEPTVEGLAAALEEAGERSARGYGLLEKVPVSELAAEVLLDDAIRAGDRARPAEPPLAPRRVLLTGGTGYLGAFLLRELLDETDADVVCLVRAESAGHALERIRGNLEAYRLWEDGLAERIVPLPGDLEQPHLGLGAVKFTSLAGTLDLIYHNGARVNFVQDYEGHKASNVGGTHEILRLAGMGELTPVHFVSTLSVFHTGDHDLERVYSESDELEETGAPLGGYAQSKWVAEQLVRQAAGRGIPASMYRPGIISGHSRTGAWNHSDLVWGLARACFTLGKIPRLGGRVDVVPVDYVSRAIVYLSRRQQPDGRVFHLGNPETFPYEEMVALIQRLGLPVDEVSFDEWRAALFRHSLEGIPNDWNAFLPIIEEVEVEQIFMPRFDASNTLAGLEGSGISCPPVGPELLGHYLDFFNREGFFR